jgi:hypothetical protein
MPTLIRLLVVLLILAGLAFGAMVGLTAVVDPGEKEIRVRIPARDLMETTEGGDPLSLRDQLPAPMVTEPDANLPATPPSAPGTNQPPPDMSTFE